MAAIQGDWYASRSTHQGEGYPQSDDTVRFVYATQPNGDKYIVAKVWAGDDGDFEGTARLIAAAPALLDRLRSMVSGAECECDTADDEHPLCDICWSRQVIAQATGKEVPNG